MTADTESKIVTKLTRLQAWRIIAYDTQDVEASKECMRILESGTPIRFGASDGIGLTRHQESITREPEYWLSGPAQLSLRMATIAAQALDPQWQSVPDLSEPLEDVDVEELLRDTLGDVETSLEECRRFLLIANTEEQRRKLAGLESALIVVQAYAQSELGITP